MQWLKTFLTVSEKNTLGPSDSFVLELQLVTKESGAIEAQQTNAHNLELFLFKTQINMELLEHIIRRC